MTTIKFLVSGHVDHGKSTLLGRILYDINHFDPREVSKIFDNAIKTKKEKWKFAHLLDILDDEREHGATHEIEKINFIHNGDNYTMIDTPGHAHLIKTLINGINSENPESLIACLIVSSDPNEFATGMGGGQTREDAILLKASGINNLIVVLNKIDLVSEEVLKKQQEQLLDFIKKLKFAHVDVAYTAGYLGTGVIELLAKIKAMHGNVLSDITIAEQMEIVSPLIKIHVKLINCDNTIISAGFECIAHIHDKEYQVVFVDVLNKETKKKFGKESDIIFGKIKQLSDAPFEIMSNARIIIRKNATTIGWGRCTPPQPPSGVGASRIKE
jgi:translation elongation factor EF-1alpha